MPSQSAQSLELKSSLPVETGSAGVIGIEPPIETGTERHTPADWHRMSLRWLIGTTMGGLAGAALIGAAIYAALDRQTNFADMPTLAQPIHKDEAPASANLRKGDRLVRPIDIVAAKQAYKITIPVKVGDKEVLAQRAFTRVATPLTLTPTVFADDVPTFDPLKLLTGAKENSESAQDQAPIIDAAEVSLANRDISDSDKITTSVILTEEEAQAEVAEQAKQLATSSKAPLPIPPQLLLMRTSRAKLGLGPGATFGTSPFGGTAPGKISDTAFTSIAVRMVPENVSAIPRSETPPTGNLNQEKLVLARKGETIEDILRNNQVSKPQIKAVLAVTSRKPGQEFVREGQKVKLLFSDLSGEGLASSLARISVYTDETLESTLAISDLGDFVPVKLSTPTAKVVTADDNTDDEETDTGGMRLYNALYETALKQELPRAIVDDLTVIFSNSVDFQRAVTAGDSFEALYTNPEEPNAKGELLYASITARNETFKYYRFQTPDDNSVDYYDEKGQSGRKFLIRKPIAFGEQKSGFGMRRHPIYGRMIMHTGVDWAAPTGTQIFAAGNGVILKAGWSSGYGRRVEIQHQGGYVTTYNHMSGFGRNVTEGERIKQGQLVGYVGATGNVTGAHLHYEVIINGRFVDPIGIKLPRTRELDGKSLNAFKLEENRINDILGKAPNAGPVISLK